MDPSILAEMAANPERRASWASHESPGAYEKRPCLDARWTTLDEDALHAYLAEHGTPAADPAVAAAREGFMVRRDSLLQPSVAGNVLFGVHPELQRQAWRIIALRLAGADRSSPVADRLETEGPAPSAITQVESFLRRHFEPEHEAAKTGLGFPLPAVLEAVTNAVAHRDYASPSQVFVRLYDDRLEIENPGGLLPGVTFEDLMIDGGSYPRNPIIARTLRRIVLPAGQTFGFARIRKEMEGLGAPPPEFAADAHAFRITLYARGR